MERNKRSPPFCKFFNAPGGCHRSNCRFLHQLEHSPLDSQRDDRRPHNARKANDDEDDLFGDYSSTESRTELSRNVNRGRTQPHAPAVMNYCEVHGYNHSHDSSTCRVLNSKKPPMPNAEHERKREPQASSPDYTIRGLASRRKDFEINSEMTEPYRRRQATDRSVPSRQQTPLGTDTKFSPPTGPRNSRQQQRTPVHNIPRHDFPVAVEPASIPESASVHHEPYLKTANLEQASLRIGKDVSNHTYCAMCLNPLDPTIPVLEQQHKYHDCFKFYARNGRDLADRWQDCCPFFEKYGLLPYCRRCDEIGKISDADMDDLMYGISKDRDDGNWSTAAGRLVAVILCKCEGRARNELKKWITE